MNASSSVELAYDYPVAGVIWSVLWLVLWLLWLVLLFHVITDIFRDREMSGGGKALWLLFVIIVPFLGVLAYVLARGADMGRREAQHTREAREDLDRYIRQAAGGHSEAEQLARLSDLKERGDLSEEEFDRAKQRVLQHH